MEGVNAITLEKENQMIAEDAHEIEGGLFFFNGRVLGKFIFFKKAKRKMKLKIQKRI